jgi:putative ABC transport system permease protein
MRALRQLWFLITRRRQEDELAEELEFHRQMKAAERRANGVSDRDLPADTQRALGNDLLARERSRDVWVAPWLQDMTQDLRFGLRMIVKERRLAVTAMVTLGLGMAVSNAAFSFVNAAMFRDLPHTSPDRLITIRTFDPSFAQAGVSYLEFREWQRHTTVFESLSAELSLSVNVSDSARTAERLSGTFITFQTFRMLDVTPIIGRDFVAADDGDGADPVTILSHSLWVNRYGADPAIVGRVVRINDQPSTVVGVMPERFAYPYVADLWMPMAMAPGLRTTTWTSTAYGAVGRLKPGIGMSQARAEIETVAARTVKDHPEVPKDRRLRVITVRDSQLANGAAPMLWALLGAAIVVLFVASANVANLLLARAWHRAREIAVRLAMGATRCRVIRQVLIECVLIGAGGAVLGSYLSWVAFQALASAFNIIEFGAPDRPRMPYWFDPSIDGVGWMFFGVAFLFASVAAGLIPALHLSKTDVNDVLKDGRLGEATRLSRRWAGALMVGQIAVALMLLAAGGLFARSYLALYNTDPVIDTSGLVTMRLTLPTQKYGQPDQRRQFVRGLDDRIRANGVFAESTISSDVPLQPFTAVSRALAIEGESPAADRQPPNVIYIMAGPRFFETFKFPVLRGRALGGLDDVAGTEGAVVNQRFATMFFGDSDPIGRRIRLTVPGLAAHTPPPWLTIVGVAPTTPDYLPNRPDDATVYATLLGDPVMPRNFSVTVRSPSKAAVAVALREEVSRLDPGLPVYAIQTLDEVLAMTRMGARMVGSWFQSLALIAAVLACVGLYALTAHGVAQRTREVGIRMALGARTTQVMWLFVRQILLLVMIGLVIGVAGALATSRVLAAFLGDINPRDPLTLVTVAAMLAVFALAAGLGPARRAARVDPIATLRAD